jgi:hypothetical protein
MVVTTVYSEEGTFCVIVIPLYQFLFRSILFEVGDYHVHVEVIIATAHYFAHASGDPTLPGILIVEVVLFAEGFEQGVAGIVVIVQ